MSTADILDRIKTIEDELIQLRDQVMRQMSADRPTVELEGIWNGVKFDEKGFEQAERSLFKQAYGSSQ